METKIKGTGYSIDVLNGTAKVKRQFEFDDGSMIEFSLTLPRDDAATLPDIHKRSVAKAIELLQMTIPKPKA